MQVMTEDAYRSRIAELEGLLAQTTANLEDIERGAVRVREENDRLDEELGKAEEERDALRAWEAREPTATAALDAAIERLAVLLTVAGEESDLWLHTEQSVTRLETAANAIRTLAQARQAVKPT